MLVQKWNGGNGSVGGRRKCEDDILILSLLLNFYSLHLIRLSSIYDFIPQPPLVCVELNPGPQSEVLDYAAPGQKWARKVPVSLSGSQLITRPPVDLLKDVINEEKEEKKEIQSLVKRYKKTIKAIKLPKSKILGKRKRLKKNKKKKKNTKGIICPKCGCSISPKMKIQKKKNNAKKRKVVFGPQTKKAFTRSKRKKLLKKKKQTAWVAQAPRGFYPQPEHFYNAQGQDVTSSVVALPPRDREPLIRRRTARALRQRNLNVASSLV